jgi:hypothetical protein
MIDKNIDATWVEKTTILKTTFEKTEALIISVDISFARKRYKREAARLANDNADTFNAFFPTCYDRYGLQSINEVDFYSFSTTEGEYDNWFESISTIRNTFPLGKPYRDLCCIVKKRNCATFTTNTDGQLFKFDFDEDKICFPQGESAWSRYSTLCNSELNYDRQRRQ